MPNRVIAFAICLILLTAVVGISAEFVPLGFPLTTLLVREPLAVSEDGSVVAGSSDLGGQIVRWTRSTGPEVLRASDEAAVGISGDGSAIVSAATRGPRLGADPVKFTDGELALLPTPDGFFYSAANVISQDGSTVWGVGNPRGESGGVLRWTDDGVTFFPNPPDRVYTPYGVSANGKVFVGSVDFCSGNVCPRGAAFRWTEEGGFQDLPASYWAWGVSSDGRWAVGRSEQGQRPTQHRGSRWDGFAPPERLLPDQEGWGTTGIDVTANGSVVVGRLYLSDVQLDRRADLAAGIWTEAAGRMLTLQDLLISHYGLGPSLEGYHLTGVYDVTDDGRFMVGHMIGPNPDSVNGEAFLVDLGLSGDFNGDEALDIADLNVLSAAIHENEPNLKFDLDYSNTVDFEDQRIWVKGLKLTVFGDANLDGQFNSSDLVAVFEVGQYEDGITGNSSWNTGDWNADSEFGTSDLVLAFQDGGYEQGPLGAAITAPEPNAMCLLLLGGCCLIRGRRSPR